jgi:hypothetical protein
VGEQARERGQGHAVTIIDLDLDNGEGEPGDYLIIGSAADPVRMGAGATQTLSLRAKARGAASIPVCRKRRREGQRGRSGGPCRQDSTGSFGLWTAGGDSGSTPMFPTFSLAPASRNWRYRRPPANWRSTGSFYDATTSPAARRRRGPLTAPTLALCLA